MVTIKAQKLIDFIADDAWATIVAAARSIGDTVIADASR